MISTYRAPTGRPDRLRHRLPAARHWPEGGRHYPHGVHLDDDVDGLRSDARQLSRADRLRRGTAAKVLMAAMVGLVEALGYEREPQGVVQFASDLDTGDLPLDFGPLPPID